MKGERRCPDCGETPTRGGCCPPCRANRELVSRILRDDLYALGSEYTQAEEAHDREQRHRARVRRVNSLYWQRRSR